MQGGYQQVFQRINNHSPYLSQCMNDFPDIPDQFRQGETPEAILKLYNQKYLGPLADFNAEMSRLRRLKRAVHLICAVADLSRLWSWAELAYALSDLADQAIQRLLRGAAIEAGIDGHDNNPVPGLFIIAMGKHGAQELNYSSDIDFTVFYDPDLIRLPNMQKAERILLRLIRSLIKGLEQRTEDGYIFRTDLRLRPDPRSNSIAVSTRTAERYYESLGQNWERAALIKARVCAGDKAVGETFKKDVISPFVWRRSLDFAAIEDIQAIKRQINARTGGSLISAAGHHVKLGHGGIREVEFYAQVQQLILGGRHPRLREMRTLDALNALSREGFMDGEITKKLTQYYSDLRDLEHGVQMQFDAQDHVLPKDDDARRSLAKLRGADNLKSFDEAALETFKNVSQIYKALYAEADSLAASEGNLVFTGVEMGPNTARTLNEMGFKRSAEVWQEMSDWLGGRIMATRSVRARELLTRLAPQLLKICQKTGQADHAFFAFARFFSNLRSGVQTLSMFVQRPQSLEQLIGFMTLSHRIADQLANDPAIMDVMSEPNYLTLTPDIMMTEFSRLDLASVDFETAMNKVRILAKEQRFRLTLSALSGNMSPLDIMKFCSDLADQVIRTLVPVAVKETQRIFGPIRGGFAIIGLGKLGGQEMRLSSDLDMMLVYAPHEDGELRPDIYAKLTQRLMSALSVNTSEGGLYEVDLTLRPSGRSGPVAVSLSAFEQYYYEKAWSWEFMALTRARIITSSSQDFSQNIRAALQSAITSKRSDLDFKADIADMLRRTYDAKPASSDWDIKNAVGGLRDIEYIAQSLWLESRHRLAASWPRSTVDMLAAHEVRLGGKTKQILTQILNDFHAVQQWQSLLEGRNDVSGKLPKAVTSLPPNVSLRNLSLKTLRSYQNKTAKITASIIGL